MGFKVIKMEFGQALIEYVNNFDMMDPGVSFMYGPAVSLTCACIYLLFVHTYLSTRKYLNMEPAKKDQGRRHMLMRLTVAHNLFLSVMSLVMGLGIGLPWVKHCQDTSLSHCLVHVPPRFMTNGAHAFWMYLFFLSKYYEFVDTALMMLRGHDIIFLHYYHHATVPLLAAVYTYERSALQTISCAFNAGIHFIMYAYYAYAATGRKSRFKRFITTAQITQFVVVFACTTNSLVTLGFWALPLSMCAHYTIYFSYLALFIQFYMRTYNTKPKSA